MLALSGLQWDDIWSKIWIVLNESKSGFYFIVSFDST